MNIFCIGRNYSEHVMELNNPLPTKPIVFCKPNGALLKDNKAFYYPDFSNDIQYEVELLIKISKPGKSIPLSSAREYFDQIGLGIDFTARDLQAECKSKGLPWEIAKGFDHSAVVGGWLNIEDLNQIEFSLLKNKKTVQKGNSSEMIFSFEKIVSYLSTFFRLGTGDIIFTGTPAGVGPIQKGDLYEGFIGTQRMFWTEIR